MWQYRLCRKQNINKLMLPRTLKHYISVNFPAPLYDIDDDTTSRYPFFYYNLWRRNQFDVFFNTAGQWGVLYRPFGFPVFNLRRKLSPRFKYQFHILVAHNITSLLNSVFFIKKAFNVKLL